MLSVLPIYRRTVAVLGSELYRYSVRLMSGGYDPGRRGGYGGGSGGTIRSAGGTFSKLQVVREEEYYLKKQNRLMENLKDRKITLDEYHTKRLKVLEEYNKILEKWKTAK